MNTVELRDYYPNLLMLEYIGKAKAYATVQTQVTPVIMPQTTVQTIAFSPIPDAGQFVLSYLGVNTIPINWNDSAAVIQAILQMLAPAVIDGGNALAPGPNILDGGNAFTTIWQEDIDGGSAFGFGLSGIVVTGSIASGLLTITFIGVTPPVDLLVLVSSTLTSSGNPVTVTITETDLTIPLAVQAGFNVTGPNPARGVQLDVLGKYVGVTRTGSGFTMPITLGDTDFLTLIQMAIIKNNAGSSLATIQNLLFQFFPYTVSVVDYTTMEIVYYIASSVASEELVELFVTEGILPTPMAVGYAVITFNATNAFGFADSVNSGGFGDISDPSIGGEFASLFYPT